MKLQLALDGDLLSSLSILQAVRPYIDLAELGTPLIYREGIAAAARIHRQFPDLPLLADFKIMDAGDEEATIAFEAGCDLVTVLGVTQDVTIQGVVAAARRFGKQVMVDMMQVNDVINRAQTLLEMGCHYLCLHTAYDVHSATKQSSLGQLEVLHRAIPQAPLAIAGGIGLPQLKAIAALHPEIIIVGSAITKAPDPLMAAQAIRTVMETL
jgi:3-hexulose-6-phosphate synthase